MTISTDLNIGHEAKLSIQIETQGSIAQHLYHQLYAVGIVTLRKFVIVF